MAVLTDSEIAEMLPATFTKPGLTEEEYFALCAKFEDFFVEYTADGTVIFIPGTDPETSEGVLEVNFQLATWARQEGRGRVTGPDASFLSLMVPPRTRCRVVRCGAMEGRKGHVTGQKGTCLRARVRSRGTLTGTARATAAGKDGGIHRQRQLGWRIDPLERTVTIYRPGQSPEVLSNPSYVNGEGPVAGLVLHLKRILSD